MNIIRCDRCGKQLLSEEFANHDCTIVTYTVQEIGIDDWFEGKLDENGDKVLIAHGLNGILYRFVQCFHNPPHPDTRPTVFDSDKIRRRFDRTLFEVLSS